jgi:hypothetical protein
VLGGGNSKKQEKKIGKKQFEKNWKKIGSTADTKCILGF